MELKSKILPGETKGIKLDTRHAEASTSSPDRFPEAVGD